MKMNSIQTHKIQFSDKKVTKCIHNFTFTTVTNMKRALIYQQRGCDFLAIWQAQSLVVLPAMLCSYENKESTCQHSPLCDDEDDDDNDYLSKPSNAIDYDTIVCCILCPSVGWWWWLWLQVVWVIAVVWGIREKEGRLNAPGRLILSLMPLIIHFTIQESTQHTLLPLQSSSKWCFHPPTEMKPSPSRLKSLEPRLPKLW